MIPSLSARVSVNLRRVLMLLLALLLMGLPLHRVPARAAVAPPAQAGKGSAAESLRVDEILARHYQAIGGDDRQRIQTMMMSGSSVVMGAESAFTRYAKRPDMMLLEIHVQGMTGIQAFDGETAWGHMPFMGQPEPAVMTVEQTRAMREDADFDGPLVHAADKGHQVELLGVEPVRGRDAYALRVTMSTGGVQTYFVDTETFRVTRVESDGSDTVMLDYRLIEGHPVPSVIEKTGPYGDQVIYIDDVDFNVDIDDTRFRMR